MRRALARLRNVSKRFGAVTALAGAQLEVGTGEVHGLLGENGAGKTTLLGVLGGLVDPDAGSVEIGGDVVRLAGPRDAWEAGVGLVHQHFTLVPRLTVLENLALGFRGATAPERAPRWLAGSSLDLAGIRRAVSTLVDETGLEVALDARVEELGVGTKQRAEILKTLLRRPQLLVLDEPTAVLTPGEVETLFGLLRRLATEGRGVVLVSHKLHEVLEVCDRVTVLRRGRTVLSTRRSDVDASGLARAMVGEELDDPVAVGNSMSATVVPDVPFGETVAELRAVRVRGARGEWVLQNVSLDVRSGEVVGIAGVEGNGQRELAAILAGRTPPAAGVARVPERVGFVPQDRTIEGLVAEFDLVHNVALALHDDPDYSRGPFLRWGRIRERTRQLIGTYGIATAGIRSRARTLSGGNQQRLVVARELSVTADLLVAENPTRGLDVVAASFVHRALRGLVEIGPGADRRPGIVLISTELEEVLALAHTVFVLAGRRLLPVRDESRTRHEVGRLMLTGRDEGA